MSQLNVLTKIAQGIPRKFRKYCIGIKKSLIEMGWSLLVSNYPWWTDVLLITGVTWSDIRDFEISNTGTVNTGAGRKRHKWRR